MSNAKPGTLGAGVRPLDGIKVLDLSRLYPGPLCSMYLADFGAEVLCLEDRRFEKDIGGLPSALRNKRHMTLNLKQEEGREIFFRLLADADIVLDGFRPGVLDRLGVGYEVAKARNPRIIYCAITGYGQTGPYADYVGHDINYNATAGLLDQTGSAPDAPPAISGVQIADVAAGGMSGVIGILLALQARERTGQGQFVDISMLDGVVGMLGMASAFKWLLGVDVGRGDGMLTGKYPFYRVYRCADGRYLSIGAVENRFWRNLCEHVGKPEWTAQQFDDAKVPEMKAFFEAYFAKKSVDEWVEELGGRSVCAAKVQNITEVLEDPHILAREMVHEFPEDSGKQPPVLGIPIKLSDTPGRIERLPARFGQHTTEILKEMGYQDEAIKALQEKGTV
jgi:crotonobetainyl-CoA:carnitine CoA-transferase CaiB-like acyl-CoA transferase